MQVRLQEIPKNGLALRYDQSTVEMDLDSISVQFKGVIAVDLFLEKLEGLVTLLGEVSTALLLECGRCLRVFEQPLRLDLRANYLPDAGDATTDNESGDGSVEVNFYSGDLIEVDKFIREQIILALPLRALCHEECLGLCVRCGQDLNQGRCDCVIEEPGGPFSTLRQYFHRRP
jgi:uncharacterized protein